MERSCQIEWSKGGPMGKIWGAVVEDWRLRPWWMTDVLLLLLYDLYLYAV